MKIPKEKLIENLKINLKTHGFKKIRTTWHKTTDTLILVFNIQGSQWSTEDYYINLGIYLKSLGNESAPPEYRCHIRTRIDENNNIELILQEANNWFIQHDSIDKLITLNKNDALPLATLIIAKEYLESII
jgi:hypothetical protein